MRSPYLVGRRVERDAVRAGLARARTGAGGVLFIVGEPGIGKSRLVRDAAAAAAADGVGVLAGRAVPSPVEAPLRPFVEVLARAFRDRDPSGDAGLARWLPALAAVAPGITGSGVPAAAVGPVEAAATRGEAMLRALRWAAGAGSLLTVLEDLHWADPETLSVLEYLADSLAGEPVLIVATLRRGASPATDLARRLGQRGAAERLDLGPLEPAEVSEMVLACRPDAGPDLVERVRAAAEGVPLLVEELVSAPTASGTVRETVRARVARLDADARETVAAAAVLGRDFDWRSLPRLAELSPQRVATALDGLVAEALLDASEDGYRFRHALIRDAVLDGVAPHRRSDLAARALTAAGVAGPQHAELALLAGDRALAGALLTAGGLDALAHGALDTAVDTLRRAIGLADDPAARSRAQAALVRALALAGRLDEAIENAAPLLEGSSSRGVHLDLAAAAVAATRWSTATAHLDAAMTGDPPPVRHDTARAAVLRAEVSLAADDLDAARDAATAALRTVDAEAAPEIACHALELLGRSHRVHDLGAARTEFDRAHRLAVRAGLPVWQLRAQHERGTVDMLDRGDLDRLVEARDTAERLGALSTVAVLDVQLAGGHLQRFDPTAALDAAGHAAALSRALRLDRVQAIAHVFEACIHAVRGDRGALDEAAATARRTAPEDVEVAGFLSAGAVGMIELLWGDPELALAAMDSGLAALNAVARSAPGPYRGLWPLLVAVTGRADAPDAAESVRRSGVAVNRINRGYLDYAEAVRDRMAGAVARGDTELAYFPAWRHIGRALVARAARRDGWGDPDRWLAEAASGLRAYGLYRFVAGPPRRGGDRPAPSGSTPRERDVLALVVAGLSNREIADQLRLSVRTVEKHVEALLRKAGARSRTQLVARTRDG